MKMCELQTIVNYNKHTYKCIEKDLTRNCRKSQENKKIKLDEIVEEGRRIRDNDKMYR